MKNYENYNASNPYDNASEDYEGHSYYDYFDDEDLETEGSAAARLNKERRIMAREALGRLDDGRDHPVTVTKRQVVSAEADTPAPKAEEPKTMSVSMEQYKSAVDWKRREYEHGTNYYRTPDGSIIPAGRYDPKDLNDAGNETVKR